MSAEGKRKSKTFSQKSKEPKAKRAKQETTDTTSRDDGLDKVVTHEKAKATAHDKEHGNKKENSMVKKATKKSKYPPSNQTNDDNFRKKNDESVNDQADDHDNSSSDSDDGDDNELLAAAAAWAQRDEPPTTTPVSGLHDEKIHDLSLHITQLPYDANELDLRRLFAEQGCRISSIRLVYDRDEKGRKTVFRGVAFVDLVDKESYDKALSLNRKSPIRGRKLNIRPTKSKQELASIVSRTRELVQEKIQKQREIGAGNGTDGDVPPGKKDDKGKKEKKKEKKKAQKQKDKGKAAKAKETKIKGNLEPKKSDISTTKVEKKEPHKLTKSERNRRAAILAGIKRKSS
jgi:RNA recognition motif-containing protein